MRRTSHALPSQASGEESSGFWKFGSVPYLRCSPERASLSASLIMIVFAEAEGGFRHWLTELVNGIDFHEAIFHWMLPFLLFAGALCRGGALLGSRRRGPICCRCLREGTQSTKRSRQQQDAASAEGFGTQLHGFDSRAFSRLLGTDKFRACGFH